MDFRIEVRKVLKGALFVYRGTLEKKVRSRFDVHATIARAGLT